MFLFLPLLRQDDTEGVKERNAVEGGGKKRERDKKRY
jgi:hypothetical protein